MFIFEKNKCFFVVFYFLGFCFLMVVLGLWYAGGVGCLFFLMDVSLSKCFFWSELVWIALRGILFSCRRSEISFPKIVCFLQFFITFALYKKIVSEMKNIVTLVDYSDVAIERGGARILEGVSFSMKSGEMVIIEGSIGSGKSSLFKTLYADLPVAGGKAKVLDFDLCRLPNRKVPRLRKRMGIVFQDFQLFDNKTVEDNLKFVIDSLGFVPPCTKEEYITQVLEHVGIYGKNGTFPHMLSGGEKQSVAIARAIVCNPELIIADEPTGNLDEASALHVAGVLYSLSQEGAGVVVATHDENIFDNFPHRTLRIEDGTLREY